MRAQGSGDLAGDEAVEKLAFEEEVRKVLGARYNLEGSLELRKGSAVY